VYKYEPIFFLELVPEGENPRWAEKYTRARARLKQRLDLLLCAKKNAEEMQAHNEEVLENNIAIKFLFGKQSLTNIINKNKEDKKKDTRASSTQADDYD
jgi:hypothetical protein